MDEKIKNSRLLSDKLHKTFARMSALCYNKNHMRTPKRSNWCSWFEKVRNWAKPTCHIRAVAPLLIFGTGVEYNTRTGSQRKFYFPLSLRVFYVKVKSWVEKSPQHYSLILGGGFTKV
jgi:hypothetical protein